MNTTRRGICGVASLSVAMLKRQKIHTTEQSPGLFIADSKVVTVTNPGHNSSSPRILNQNVVQHNPNLWWNWHGYVHSERLVLLLCQPNAKRDFSPLPQVTLQKLQWVYSDLCPEINGTNPNRARIWNRARIHHRWIPPVHFPPPPSPEHLSSTLIHPSPKTQFWPRSANWTHPAHGSGKHQHNL